jgi:hypothetical protein
LACFVVVAPSLLDQLTSHKNDKPCITNKPIQSKMKSLKFLAVAALAATVGHSAFATTYINITGSTAYRTATLAAIAANYTLGALPLVSGGGTGNDTTFAGVNANTSFIFEGGNVSGTACTVRCTFTGSQTGVASVAGSYTNIPFLPDGSSGVTNNASTYDDAVGSIPHSGYPQGIADFCMSDVYQGTTAFNGNVTLASGSTINFKSLTDKGPVALVTFKWVASTGFPVGTGTTGTQSIVSSVNVEPYFLQSLMANGIAPLSQATGNAGDKTVEIYLTGRNPDSGTRGTALSDTNYGNLTAVQQYQQTALTGLTVTAQQLYPIATIAGLSTNSAGNSGEASGANLRTYMTYTLSTSASVTGNSPTACYYLTYLGIGDAGKVEGTSNGGGVELAYKGVNYSNAAIYSGQYTFWSYEHLYERSNIANPAKLLASNMATTIKGLPTSNAAIAGVGISASDPNLLVTRIGDGAYIVPNFSF